jgi:hypothetical protein
MEWVLLGRMMLPLERLLLPAGLLLRAVACSTACCTSALFLRAIIIAA